MPYDVLEPEQKGYEVLEPEAPAPRALSPDPPPFAPSPEFISGEQAEREGLPPPDAPTWADEGLVPASLIQRGIEQLPGQKLLRLHPQGREFLKTEAEMASGFTSPTGLAMGAALALVPEAALPAGIAFGGPEIYGGVKDILKGDFGVGAARAVAGVGMVAGGIHGARPKPPKPRAREFGPENDPPPIPPAEELAAKVEASKELLPLTAKVVEETVKPKAKVERLPRAQQAVGAEPVAGEYRVTEEHTRPQIEAEETAANAQIQEAWTKMTEAERDNARHGRGIPKRFGGRADDVPETREPPMPEPPAPPMPATPVVPLAAPAVHAAPAREPEAESSQPKPPPSTEIEGGQPPAKPAAKEAVAPVAEAKAEVPADMGAEFLTKHGVKADDAVTVQLSKNGRAYPGTVTGYAGEGKISVRMANRAPVPKEMRGQERIVDPLTSNLQRPASVQGAARRQEALKPLQGAERKASLAREKEFDRLIKHDPELDPPSEKAAQAIGKRSESIVEHERKMSARERAFKELGLTDVDHRNPVAVADALPKLQRLMAERRAQTESLQLEPAESVAEQRARLEQEQRTAEERAASVARETARATKEREARTRLAAPIGGDLGTAGQGKLFAEPGQQEIFQTQAPMRQGPGGRTARAPEVEPAESFEGTGLKHAIDELERISHGFKERTPQERQAMAEAWERSASETTPAQRSELAKALVANPTRGLTGDESAMLLRRKVELLNELNAAAERTHSLDPDVKLEARASVERLEQELNDFLDAVASRGSEWGREGRWRQALAQEDFSFEHRSAILRAKKGEPLSHEEIERLRKQTAEDAETLRKYEAYILKLETKQREVGAQKAVEAIEAEPRAEPLATRQFRQEWEKFRASVKKQNGGHREAGKAILSRFASMEAAMKQGPGARTARGLEISDAEAKQLVDELKFTGSEKITDGFEDPIVWDRAMREEFGEQIEPFLKDLYEASVKLNYEQTARHFGEKTPTPKQKKAAKPVADQQKDLAIDIKEKLTAEKPEDVSPLAQKLAGIAVAQGARGWRAVADAVHKQLRTVLPELDFHDTLDMISGYGKFRAVSQDTVRVALAQAKQEMQTVRKIQDVVAKKPLKKTGFQFQPFSDVKRRLIAVLNEAKKKFGVVVTNPEAQLKSALDARKKHYDNRITDLQHEIKTRQKIVRERNLPPTDAELTAKIGEYRKLKAERDEIFDSAMTDEQRMKVAIKALGRSEAEYRRRREAGEFARTKKEEAAYQKSSEYQAAEARRDAEKAAFEELRDLDEAFQVQAELRQVANLDRRIAEVSRQINEGEVEVATRPASTASEAVKAKREELAELNKIKAQLRRAATAKSPEERALAAYQTRLTNRTAEQAERLAYLRARLESGEITEADLKRPKREPLDLSKHPELVNLKAQSDAIRQNIMRAEREAAYYVKPPLKKAWYRFQQGRGAAVNIASSFDFSAPRQALTALLSNSTRVLTRPGLIGRPTVDMFKSWWTESNAVNIEARRQLRPNAQNGLDKTAGIEYSELNSERFTRYEENAHSILDEWAALPWRGETSAGTITGAPFKAGARAVRMSNRAFIAFLNSTRAELFDHLLKINFKDRPPTEIELKAIGNLVNVTTGRGKINPKTAQAMTEFLWAPKLLASRVQLLTGQPFYGGTARTRLIVGKEYARMIGSGIILGLVARFFDDDKGRDWTPVSSDFGKIKRDNVSVDIWGGFQQPVVLGARLLTGEKETAKGKTVDLTKDYGDSLWLTGTRFVRSKLRPDVAAAVDLATRSNMIGEPWTPAMAAESVLVPLPLRDVAALLREQGFPEAVILQALQELGVGVQVREPRSSSR